MYTTIMAMGQQQAQVLERTLKRRGLSREVHIYRGGRDALGQKR